METYCVRHVFRPLSEHVPTEGPLPEPCDDGGDAAASPPHPLTSCCPPGGNLVSFYCSARMLDAEVLTCGQCELQESSLLSFVTRLTARHLRGMLEAAI